MLRKASTTLDDAKLFFANEAKTLSFKVSIMQLYLIYLVNNEKERIKPQVNKLEEIENLQKEKASLTEKSDDFSRELQSYKHNKDDIAQRIQHLSTLDIKTEKATLIESYRETISKIVPVDKANALVTEYQRIIEENPTQELINEKHDHLDQLAKEHFKEKEALLMHQHNGLLENLTLTNNEKNQLQVDKNDANQYQLIETRHEMLKKSVEKTIAGMNDESIRGYKGLMEMMEITPLEKERLINEIKVLATERSTQPINKKNEELTKIIQTQLVPLDDMSSKIFALNYQSLTIRNNLKNKIENFKMTLSGQDNATQSQEIFQENMEHATKNLVEELNLNKKTAEENNAILNAMLEKNKDNLFPKTVIPMDKNKDSSPSPKKEGPIKTVDLLINADSAEKGLLKPEDFLAHIKNNSLAQEIISYYKKITYSLQSQAKEIKPDASDPLLAIPYTKNRLELAELLLNKEKLDLKSEEDKLKSSLDKSNPENERKKTQSQNAAVRPKSSKNQYNQLPSQPSLKSRQDACLDGLKEIERHKQNIEQIESEIKKLPNTKKFAKEKEELCKWLNTVLHAAIICSGETYKTEAIENNPKAMNLAKKSSWLDKAANAKIPESTVLDALDNLKKAEIQVQIFEKKLLLIDKNDPTAILLTQKITNLTEKIDKIYGTKNQEECLASTHDLKNKIRSNDCTTEIILGEFQHRLIETLRQLKGNQPSPLEKPIDAMIEKIEHARNFAQIEHVLKENCSYGNKNLDSNTKKALSKFLNDPALKEHARTDHKVDNLLLAIDTAINRLLQFKDNNSKTPDKTTKTIMDKIPCRLTNEDIDGHLSNLRELKANLSDNKYNPITRNKYVQEASRCSPLKLQGIERTAFPQDAYDKFADKVSNAFSFSRKRP